MSAAPHESRGWSPLKWLLVIGGVFVLQAGLFFWLGSHKPASMPAVSNAGVVVQIATSQSGAPGFDNPLLLVTPSVNGFSQNWMEAPAMTNQPVEWTGESNAELGQPVRPLGGEINTLVTNTLISRFSVVDRPKPGAGAILLPPEPDEPAESALRIRGDLAGRALVSPPKLQPQYWNSPLSDSLIQIDVDAYGNVYNPPIKLPNGSSGSPDTDAYAQEVARSLRFQPLPEAGAGKSPIPTPQLTTGTLVIHWRTEAPAPSNAPAGNP